MAVARRTSRSAGVAAKKPVSTRVSPGAKPRSRPLLVIDGDSFAHRAYHGLPKTIKRSGGGGAGAIVGFANYLIRLYEAERPRAVVVGWDTLDVPTYRHRALPDYQSGRHFDRDLLEQLDLLPHFVEACGFTAAKAPGYEADDFLAAAVAREEKRRGIALVATGDRDAFQLVSERTTVLFPVRAGQMDRVDPAGVRARYGVDPKQVPDFIALRGDPSDRNPRHQRRRPTGCGVDPAPVRDAGSGACRGEICRAGEGTAALSLSGDDGRFGAAAPPPRPCRDLGNGGQARDGVGTWPIGGAPCGPCLLGLQTPIEAATSVSVSMSWSRTAPINSVTFLIPRSSHQASRSSMMVISAVGLRKPA